MKHSELPEVKEASQKWLTKHNRNYIDEVKCAPSDDDTNYTVMAQHMIERYGLDFTPFNVLETWMDFQPKNAYCTAERVAYMNFLKNYVPPYRRTTKIHTESGLARKSAVTTTATLQKLPSLPQSLLGEMHQFHTLKTVFTVKCSFLLCLLMQRPLKA